MAALSPALLIRGGSSRLDTGDSSDRWLTRGRRSAGLGLVLAGALALVVTMLMAGPAALVGLPLQAAASTWRPGQAFDLVAARQLVEGSEIVAGSYGRASRFRVATAVGGLCALLLFALR